MLKPCLRYVFDDWMQSKSRGFPSFSTNPVLIWNEVTNVEMNYIIFFLSNPMLNDPLMSVPKMIRLFWPTEVRKVLKLRAFVEILLCKRRGLYTLKPVIAGHVYVYKTGMSWACSCEKGVSLSVLTSGTNSAPNSVRFWWKQISS